MFCTLDLYVVCFLCTLSKAVIQNPYEVICYLLEDDDQNPKEFGRCLNMMIGLPMNSYGFP